jgi:xanthine dehydrogenase accessory factor
VSEFEAVMRAALSALDRGETVVLATVVQARGSTPRHGGARMLIDAEGGTVGTIGGATLEQRVLADARAVLSGGGARLARYVFSTRPDDPDSVGLCGGAVDVYLERLAPDPVLVIIGAGHIARALAALAAELDARVHVVDDRAEFVTRERFPRAAGLHHVAYEPATERLAPLPLVIPPGASVVVATWGWDLPALEQVLAGPAAYVGLVASQTKWRAIAARLKERGVPEAAIARVHAPIGLDLGAETPAEIALAILAEITAVRGNSPAGTLSSFEPRPVA